MGIGVDDSMASASEVADAIHQQNDTPKDSPKKKAKVNIMDSAVGYIKSSTDKKKAYDSIIAKYGDDLTDRQKEGLKKFV